VYRLTKTYELFLIKASKNPCVLGDVEQVSISIVISNAEVFNTTLCQLAPQLAGIHWHAVGTKHSVLTRMEHRELKNTVDRVQTLSS